MLSVNSKRKSKYSNKVGTKIRKLYVGGKSQREIAKIVKIPWQSVWLFIKDIRTEDRVKLPRTFTKQIPKSQKITAAKARILACLAGDGYVGEGIVRNLHIYSGVKGVTKRYRSGRKTKISFYNKDKNLVCRFMSDVKLVYGLDARYNPNRYEVNVFSSKMYDDLTKNTSFGSRTWSIPIELLNADKTIKAEWLKAFFDCEGNVETTGRHKRVNLASVNKKGLEQIRDLLHELGIDSYINGPYGTAYRLRISKKHNLCKFLETVGFGHPAKQQLLSNIVISASYKNKQALTLL